ncbi:MAG: signal peptidase II [Gammaproteobacteria bacterium]|nr:signal peptidase II [Gammaproteobacteria bacterium]
MLRLGLVIAAVIMIADQITKVMATNSLMLYQPLPVMPMFNLTLMHNTGAAFSFLSEAGGWQRWFFTALAIGVSGVIIYWLRKMPATERWQGIGLALIMGGALGNVIDRIRLGYVVDFIQVYYDTYYWPAFNVADSAITIGAGILLVMSFRKEHA